MEDLQHLICDEIGLKETHFDAFLQLASIKSLKKNETLIAAKSVCNFLGIVKSGTLRSFIKRADEEFNNDFYFANHYEETQHTDRSCRFAGDAAQIIRAANIR